MADDKAKVGKADRDRINLNEDYEVRDWVKSLNTTELKLRNSVARVGNSAAKVREDLESRAR